MAQNDAPTGIGQTGLGSIFAVLATSSSRPRYAFLVLQLVAEAANGQGRAGPFVQLPAGPMGLRDWLCTQLMPMSDRNVRRTALRARVTAAIGGRLTGNADRDERLIAEAVDEQVLSVGRTNVSRAISDLVRVKMLRRHYAGYSTNHQNRGGGRHAVYVIEPETLRALGKTSDQRFIPDLPRQGQLFAA